MPMAGGKIDPFEHVVDRDHVGILESAGLVVHLPKIELFGQEVPTLFLLIITTCAIAVAVAMLWLGSKMKSGEPPRGYLWNLLESLLFFVRDKIARPGVGEHDADKYLPYLTTLFLFIFAMNLFGLLPYMASPTAAITVTAALAIVSFFVIHISGFKELGASGYLKTFIPQIHMEGGAFMQLMAKMIVVGMAVLEYATAFIRATVLAIRLFANMLAGHTVLFMILFFIAMVDNPDYKIEIAADWMYWAVMPFSVILVTALSLLELFIAGLQAFIFTFLTAVFIGLAKHPPH
jgi:F-type H+-transporting ATPase subunit a